MVLIQSVGLRGFPSKNPAARMNIPKSGDASYCCSGVEGGGIKDGSRHTHQWLILERFTQTHTSDTCFSLATIKDSRKDIYIEPVLVLGGNVGGLPLATLGDRRTGLY